MCWFSRLAVLLLLAAVAGSLGGCGFSPVYARGGNAGMENRLAQIEIEPIADRVGQILRNQLLDEVTPRGQPSNPRYRLQVNLHESIRVLSVQKNEIATRANLNLSADFKLSETSSKKLLFSNSVQAISSYNIATADYGNVAAENNARVKAVRTLSGDIKNRLISYFLRANQTATK